jgi:hypothetical protein
LEYHDDNNKICHENKHQKNSSRVHRIRKCFADAFLEKETAPLGQPPRGSYSRKNP